MATRAFSLIIGIDSYKSGSIWNLESCVDDAKKIKHWLTHDLHVPRDQIVLLLNDQATKRTIEDTFMNHLVNNPAIERGDAILVYFAGHGSNIRAPREWFSSGSGTVDVLCPYDHDTNGAEGRIAGISDRSMQALVHSLYKAKGDNITLFLDCCFNPHQSSSNVRDRSHTRWTPTTKAKPDDLYLGLWPQARGERTPSGAGFFQTQCATHVLLAACGPGEKALEDKEGGRFTNAFLEVKETVPLHRTTYAHLIDYVFMLLGDSQQPRCLGKNKDSVLLGGSPFSHDSRYIPVDSDNDKRLRIQAGAIHGIVEGSEFTVHIHNYKGSHNPPIANVRVLEVHPTWSLGRCKSDDQLVPKGCWAKITRWNNRTPFRVYLKSSVCSLIGKWKYRRQFPSKVEDKPSKGGLNIIRVKHAAQADVTLSIGRHNIVLERHSQLIADSSHRVIRLEKSKGIANVVDDAARFQLHLCRKNPEKPLKNQVTMKLFHVDPRSWKKVGPNLLEDGRARIEYDKEAIFSVIVHNQSNTDLWPYLAYMDPNSYGITMVYHPNASSKLPPLPKGGSLEIGSGAPGSEALSFTLADNEFLDSGFLKLFLSSTPVPMGVIEQGSPLAALDAFDARSMLKEADKEQSSTPLWDTATACVTVTRHLRQH